MSNLDDKLKEIVEPWAVEMTDVIVAQIKQIFADEGFVPDTRLDFFGNSPKPEVYMTAQEWLERFEKELKTKYDTFVDFADIDMNVYNNGKEAMMLASLEAAQKATGLS